MVHTKSKTKEGSRPLCFYLHPEVATRLQAIATHEGRPFYRQAAWLIEHAIETYFEERKKAS